MLTTRIAWLLATAPDAATRDATHAMELARKAVRLSEAREPVYLDTLAAAFAAAGRFPEAIDTAKQAQIRKGKGLPVVGTSPFGVFDFVPTNGRDGVVATGFADGVILVAIPK